MREIEFRGMDIHGDWHYGLLCKLKGHTYISNRAGVPRAYDVRPETVGQYIGRKDENKNKIYGGDILDLHSTVNGVHLFSVFYDAEKARFSIKYHTNRMVNRSLDYEYSVSDFFAPCRLTGEVEYEIVGDIYHNPELLES